MTITNRQNQVRVAPLQVTHVDPATVNADDHWAPIPMMLFSDGSSLSFGNTTLQHPHGNRWTFFLATVSIVASVCMWIPHVYFLATALLQRVGLPCSLPLPIALSEETMLFFTKIRHAEKLYTAFLLSQLGVRCFFLYVGQWYLGSPSKATRNLQKQSANWTRAKKWIFRVLCSLNFANLSVRFIALYLYGVNHSLHTHGFLPVEKVEWIFCFMWCYSRECFLYSTLHALTLYPTLSPKATFIVDMMKGYVLIDSDLFLP